MLGIPTEHNRFDRDQYIFVNRTNVINGFEKEYEAQAIAGAMSNFPYDYESVTHYPEYAFAKDAGFPVLVAQNYKGGKLGQRKELSEIDKEKLRLMYGDCRMGE